MNRKVFYSLFLILPIAVLGAWTASLEYAVRGVPEVKIAATGYDPRDLIAGHYLNLRVDWQKTDCTQFTAAICPKDRFRGAYHFYVAEDKAVPLEEAIRKYPEMSVEMVFAYPLQGEPKLKNLLLDNTPWQEWSANRSAADE